MSGCAGKREQKGVRDCRGGLIGVSVGRAEARLGLAAWSRVRERAALTDKRALLEYEVSSAYTGDTA